MPDGGAEAQWPRGAPERGSAESDAEVVEGRKLEGAVFEALEAYATRAGCAEPEPSREQFGSPESPLALPRTANVSPQNAPSSQPPTQTPSQLSSPRDAPFAFAGGAPGGAAGPFRG